MSLKPIGKKWQFEIPPLDWKAPEANKDADAKVIPTDGESAEDAESRRSSTK